jgi:hypothetical protein
MPLQERLDRIREGFEKQAPPEALAVMHRATEDLRNSGILERVLMDGQSAPGLTLADSKGEQVNLAAQWKQGPVVLTFFRGHW